jgi:FAD synthase
MKKYLVKSENKTKVEGKFALFIGRWQSLHDGHKWLFHQKLKEGENVCIAIRDVPKDDKNWWSAEQIKANVEKEYSDLISKGKVKVIIIPDIDSINFGRGVGYDIIEHCPPKTIEEISATKIRQKLIEDGEKP